MFSSFLQFLRLVWGGFQVDAALFASGEGKKDQSTAMSDLTKEVREAMAVEEGEESTEGRYNEHDVAVSRKPCLSAGSGGAEEGGGYSISCMAVVV